MMPPVTPFIGLGRWCFFTLFAPSTTTCSASTILSTVPRLPLSRPAITTTSSPFLILRITLVPLQHFRRERDDLHELLAAQFPRDRPEDACADRLELRRQQHCGVAVEFHQRPVVAAHALRGAHHHRVVDLTLLDAPARCRVLDTHLDHVTDARIAPLRASQHLDAHHRARARVVRDIQNGLHLNHCCASWLRNPVKVPYFPNLDRQSKVGQYWSPSGSDTPHPKTALRRRRKIIRAAPPTLQSQARLLDQLHHPPRFARGERPAFLDHDAIALVVLVFLVVGVIFLGARDHFAVQRVLHAALDQDRHGLVHLIAHHAPGQRAPVRCFAHVLIAFTSPSAPAR